MPRHHKATIAVFLVLWGATAVAVWLSTWRWVWCIAVIVISIPFYARITERCIAPRMEKWVDEK